MIRAPRLSVAECFMNQYILRESSKKEIKSIEQNCTFYDSSNGNPLVERPSLSPPSFNRFTEFDFGIEKW